MENGPQKETRLIFFRDPFSTEPWLWEEEYDWQSFPSILKRNDVSQPRKEKSLSRCRALVPAATLLVHLAPRPCMACHRRRDVAQSRWLGVIGEMPCFDREKLGWKVVDIRGGGIHKTTRKRISQTKTSVFFFQVFKCPTLQPPRLLGMARRGPWHMWTAWRRFVAARRRCMEHGAEVP